MLLFMASSTSPFRRLQSNHRKSNRILGRTIPMPMVDSSGFTFRVKELQMRSTFLLLGLCFCLAQPQPTTHPAEARALNSVFRQWGISAGDGQWNISGELCTGAALDDTHIDDPSFNPFIKCDCSYNNAATCHIRELKVTALNVEGPIPDELWTLSYLTNLNLGYNYLTGPLSPSVANLTRMEWLNFGINALSGELPKELGMLSNLRLLGIGANNFSGPLPPELGNCLKLEQLYIDSSGVSGEIPPTFANLQNLASMWARDTELTGKIPAFIGSWSKLASLRLQGNAFEGPIPSTFANLTSLTELRIGGLLNGSSSLSFIKNMKSLSILDLRNNGIYDAIPLSIRDYGNLTELDLSFNNITGEIPDSLFNLNSLTHLFLGNNKLNGTLPAKKSPSLLNIDLSYNYLKGSFPPWVNQNNLSLNLVANNFTIERSNSSVLPSGLNCLQRNFPCNRGSGLYYSFAIDCGGPQVTSSDGTVFEKENHELGPASYYVTDTTRWAVSNVGYFTGSNNPRYTISSLAQFANTLDSQLFQTARISASSLRYYGLGLENGNYTVSLQFAETKFMDSNRWESRGRRVFDVYIQGQRVLKDFDIRKEAGGFSTRAVKRDFKTMVSENYLELHLFWAGKGTCCVPARGTYGPSISAISVNADFMPTVNNKPPTSKSRTGLTVGIIIGVGVVSSVFAVAFCILRRRRSSTENEELSWMDTKPYTFSYAELRTATQDFSSANKLGEGGFGPVYKGQLSDGRTVAVKQLSVASRQGKSQFVAEIATISGVQHRNLVKLYGCCIDADQCLIVYEYLENKSLDKALFDKSLSLDWQKRFAICMGVARGLAYLHEESRLRIVHRDVKSSNILLDADLIPKISDFGLAKLYDDKKTHMSTGVAGTIGYLAPEYAMRGHLTEKTDVFAFGVVALEILSGRPNSDPSLGEDKIYLLEWAWHLHETNREAELVESCLSEFNEEEVERVIGVALLCTQASPVRRPAMSRVVAMLAGDVQVGRVRMKPGYLTDWKFDEDATSFSSEKPIMNSSTDTSLYASTPITN